MFSPAARTLQRSARALQSVASTSRLTARPLPRFALPTLRTFSTTPLIRGQGESDAELSSKLAQEIAFERENNASLLSGKTEPEFVTLFKQKGIWKIDEQPGMDEVFLTRQFGNEHIRILVSIGDIDTAAGVPDPELEGEETHRENEEEEEVAAFPVRMAITISKPGKGAMTLEAVAQDGEMSIDNITFLKDNKMAEDLTPEADWARRGVYVGPQFDTLDEAVQEQFENFLLERGIDQDLALFIPNFAEYKEQKEYCQWLQNVKDFVDA
uniref:Putative mitochondrial p32 family protein n=1 Tax=Thecaphora frezii TaxID=1269715 RepID=A0A8T9N017_9BASI|nr:putative mitochondrial p32 family protein [Thecaphora frezii]